jgi:response regulator RpfG family c-di-GMP phosphodiesterase
VDVRELKHGKKALVGFLVEFIDRTAERKYLNTMEEYNSKLEKEVEEKTEHITFIKDMMVLGMAEMVESRDANTGGHIKRTSEVVHIFAERLMQCKEQFGLSEAFLKLVIKAAPMHDLGKVAIDDAVLRKPGKYTEEEYAEMKRHSAEGARIVESILQGVEDDAFVEVAKNVAYYHHEKWNGQGYPIGKAGTEIPIEARIMALADVFDALVSKRCYKDAFSYDEAFRIIDESLGQHFDPDLGKVFMACRADLEAFYNENK